MDEDTKARDEQLGPRSGAARSWYEVLELPRDATSEEIEAAYDRAIALIEGRSIGGYLMLDPVAMESARHDVETAFLILSDPDERARFDAELARREGPFEPRRRDAEGAARTVDEEKRRAPAPEPAPPEVAPAPEPTPRAEPEPASPSRRPKLSLKILAPVEAPARDVAPVDPAPGETRPSAPPLRIARPVVLEEVSDPKPVHRVELHDEDKDKELPPDGEINGQVIRRIREARGISIASLAEATKISKSYLLAIEEQNLEDLPARVYLRGFLTQIARVLKVDRTRLAEGYLAFVERYRR